VLVEELVVERPVALADVWQDSDEHGATASAYKGQGPGGPVPRDRVVGGGRAGKGLLGSGYHSAMTRRAPGPRADRIERNQAAVRLLRSWLAEPPAEGEREAWEQVTQALDAGRGPEREVFSEG